MMFVGDGVMELRSAVAAWGVGVAAGIGAWSEQAPKTKRIGTSAHNGSLVIRVLSSFSLGIGAGFQIHNESD